MSRELPYRKARFAGAWYSDNPELLRSEIDGYITASKTKPTDYFPRIGLLPHAGLFYSGRGIAHFFACLPEQTKRICILAPSHYEYLPEDKLAAADYSFVETPIGNLPYDPMCGRLPGYLTVDGVRAVKEEHAVEMFLPFIARVAEQRGNDISVALGLVSRFSSVENIKEFAESLMECIGEEQLQDGRTVLIASSDFTHYGMRFGHAPYGTGDLDAVTKQVEQEDRSYAVGFASGQVAEVFERCRKEHPTICGFAPALLASSIASHLGFSGKVVDYYNSNNFAQNPLPDFVSYSTVLWE
ncbi:MAG: AmmeMemoRadiSam system protein B [Spirochaetota bacterium]